MAAADEAALGPDQLGVVARAGLEPVGMWGRGFGPTMRVFGAKNCFFISLFCLVSYINPVIF